MNVGSSTSVSFSSGGIDLDPEGRLAVLVLENQETRLHAANEDKLLARERYTDAANQEVEAMRDKADHLFVGALVQGAASISASAIQMRDALTPGRCQLDEVKAAAFTSIAPVLGRALGDSPAANDEADAKRASSLAEQARWQLDDANKVIDRSQQSQDKAIDWVSAVNANQASAETGIIAGFA